jgi:hypothetical protein
MTIACLRIHLRQVDPRSTERAEFLPVAVGESQ